jgi:hypothetical protein
MSIDTILIIALFAGLAGAYLWSQRRAIQDANAMAWATAAEPFEVISRHHADTTVSSEAAYIREQLKAHGNKYLNPETDVWEYVYSADNMTTSTTRDFQLWKDLVLSDVINRREAWRTQKMQWNADAAKQTFAGQKTSEVVYEFDNAQQNTGQ